MDEWMDGGWMMRGIAAAVLRRGGEEERHSI
jgi:hypothetical protein